MITESNTKILRRGTRKTKRGWKNFLTKQDNRELY